MTIPTPDTKYLQQRGALWLFHWRVPQDCKDAFGGKSYYVKSLETHSLRTAQRRRQQVLAECLRVVDETRAGGAMDDVRALFRSKLSALQKASPENLEAAYFHHIDKEPTSPSEEALREALRVEYHGYDSELAKSSLKDALRLYLSEKERNLKRNTVLTVKKSAATLLEHLQKADIVLESITRKEVRGFVKASDLASNTMGSRLSFLSTMFQMAQDHGEIPESAPNPFAHHRLGESDSQKFQLFTP